MCQSLHVTLAGNVGGASIGASRVPCTVDGKQEEGWLTSGAGLQEGVELPLARHFHQDVGAAHKLALHVQLRQWARAGSRSQKGNVPGPQHNHHQIVVPKGRRAALRSRKGAPPATLAARRMFDTAHMSCPTYIVLRGFPVLCTVVTLTCPVPQANASRICHVWGGEEGGGHLGDGGPL